MPPKWSPKDMPRLLGKVAVLTGGTSGIGTVTVKHLASHGAKVYFTARSESKGKKTQTELLKDVPGLTVDKIPFVTMDLLDISSIQKATKTIREKEDKVDILINNAGFHTPGLERTEYGWEMCLAVIHIGHFVFMNGLMPLLKKATTYKDADVRIVDVNSNGQHFAVGDDYPLDFNSRSLLHGEIPYEPALHRYFIRPVMFTIDMVYYGIAKIAATLTIKELQRRLDEENIPIICMSIHPGVIKTDTGFANSKSLLKLSAVLTGLSIDQGTWNSLFAATAKEVRASPDTYKGKYMISVDTLHPGHRIRSNDEQARACWNSTQSEVESYLAEKKLPPLLPW